MSSEIPPSSPLFAPNSLKRKAQEPNSNSKRQNTCAKPVPFLPKGVSRPDPKASIDLSTISTTPSPCSRLQFPQTPGAQFKKNVNCSKMFEGTSLEIKTDLNPINIGIKIPMDNIYIDDGVIRNVLKQPTESKSCSAYCLAMLASDLIRENQNLLQLDRPFLDWMDRASMLKPNQVKSQASKYGISLENTMISDNHLKQLREKLMKSGHSLIVSIDHPKIQGHDIVIDRISDTHTTLRDPYTGRAWKISNKEMEYNLTNEDCPQSCLSLSTESN